MVFRSHDIPRLLDPSALRDRASEAWRLASPCRLCPRGCGVERPAGELGYCATGPGLRIGAVTPHFGEEPPLSVDGGAGAIFLTGCSMSCVYCQNHQISQGCVGHDTEPDLLAREMLKLQRMECANIDAVSPSHQLPGFLEALAIARENGLQLPLVYNTNGYETQETLEILDGVVDVYLPDLRYASNENALRYSDTPDYVDVAREAILEMHRQVGNLVVDLRGRAVRGMIIRLLALPSGIAGVEESLRWIKDNLPASVTLSLMSQYAPLHKASAFPELNAAVAESEYERLVDYAWDMGFENVYVQDMSASACGIPDFESPQPFVWDEES